MNHEAFWVLLTSFIIFVNGSVATLEQTEAKGAESDAPEEAVADNRVLA